MEAPYLVTDAHWKDHDHWKDDDWKAYEYVETQKCANGKKVPSGEKNFDRDKECPWCQRQEIDPLTVTYFYGPDGTEQFPPAVALNYRGSEILEGDSGSVGTGCDHCPFFKWAHQQLSVAAKECHPKTLPFDSQSARLWRFSVAFPDASRDSDGHFKLSTLEARWRCSCGKWYRSKDPPVTVMVEKFTPDGKLNPAAEFVQNEAWKLSLRQDDIIQRAKVWINDCRYKHHKECRWDQLRATDPPSRLVEFWLGRSGSPDDVRWKVVKPKDRVSYAALSYCRGEETQEERDEIQRLGLQGDRSASLSILPATIRDAIVTTKDLGLKYLWIDFLCIDQENPEQMNEALQQMKSIYENAELTISASRARTIRDGFLQDITQPSREERVFRLPYACPNGKPGKILVPVKLSQAVEPIDLRAWTFQEYLLSNRVLKFTSYGIYWTCRTDKKSQTLDLSPMSGVHQVKGHVDKLNTLYESFGHGEMQNEQWMEIVKAYNFRELSKPDDILRAFAGIAQFWSRSHPQRSLDASCYLAGLWKDQLPIQLLWYNFKKPERRPSRRNSRGDRVPIYLAPSWSWACINGFINMPPNLPPPDPFITTKCFFKSIFDFGPPVESAAALGIKAKKTAALLKPRDSNRNWADKLSLYDTSTGKSRRLWCDVWLDALQLNWIADPPDTVDVHCLQICPYDAGSRSGPCGLILMRMNESIYHRIGIFCFQKRKSEDAQQQSLFKDIHREIVTLI